MKKYIIFSLTLFSLVSCKKSFLDTDPTDRFTQNTYWKTKEQAEAALTATYATLLNSSIYAAENSVNLDALTPNTYRYNGDLNIISRGLHNAATGLFNSVWNASYQGIGRANNLLANIDKVSMDETLRNRYKAEAKFLRAMYYFPLWNLYGGAPLITDGTNFETQANLPRNSADELLSQILKDLDEAADGEILPLSYTGSDKGRVTLGAVYALKARVLLYASRWNEAAEVAKKVIDLGNYTLFPDYRGLFLLENEGNNEVIFDVQYKYPEFTHSLDVSLDQQLGNAPLPDLLNDYYDKDGQPIAGSSIYNPAKPFENRDPRLNATVILPGTLFKGAVVTDIQYPSTGMGMKKYTIFKDNEKPTAPPTSGTSELNYIVIRYADVLLTYAEAQNEAFGPDESVYNALNQVRKRAGMPNVTPDLDKTRLREEIRHERRIELAGEGLYYFDIRRWKTADKVLNTDAYNLTGDRIDSRSFDASRDYLWPVPSLASQNNTSLDQNPNYGK